MEPFRVHIRVGDEDHILLGSITMENRATKHRITFAPVGMTLMLSLSLAACGSSGGSGDTPRCRRRQAQQNTQVALSPD